MSHPSQCSSSARSSLSAEQLSPSPAAAAAATAARHALHSQRIVKPRSRLPPSSQARSASFASFASSSSSPPSAAAAAAPFSPGSLPAHTPFLVRLRHYLAGALLSLTSVSSLSNFTSSSHSFSSSPAWLLGSRYRSLANTAYHPVSGMQQQRQQQHCSSSSSHSADAASVDSSSLSVSRSSSSPSAAAGRAAVLSDVGSRFWFSYRSGFPPLSADPSMALSSDAGWGCMLRSTQMLFAYALTLHYLGRHWRRQSAIGPGGGNDKHTSSVNEQLQQQQQAYLSILSWFLDSPSAPYSIHSLLGAPYSSSSTLSSTAAASSSLSSSVPSPPSPSTPRAGEWFGPTATCHMLLRCRAAQVAAAGGESHIDVPAILVSDDGTLYEDELIRLCRPSSSSSLPLSPPSVSGSGDSEEARFRPVVLLIPVRLGADRINEAYIEPLLSCFQFGQSLGMMGGKPRSSYWFIGVQDERVLYLDPHTVQPAVDGSAALLSAAACSSFHTQQLYSTPAQQLDPSMALGFYIHDWQDWLSFVQHARSLEDRHAAYALVRVKETRGWRPTSSDEAKQQQQQEQHQQQAHAGGVTHPPHLPTERTGKAISSSSGLSAPSQVESSAAGASDEEDEDEFVLL